MLRALPLKPAVILLLVLMQLAKLCITMYPRQPAIATVGRAVVAILNEAQQ
jgi:hypothetical protein